MLPRRMAPSAETRNLQEAAGTADRASFGLVRPIAAPQQLELGQPGPPNLRPS